MLILKQNFKIKRIYETPAPEDGYRVLIDRLWPRGIKKEQAKVDLWMKEIAPSQELRKWFCHDPELFPQFREYYLNELTEDPLHKEQVEILKQKLMEEPVTLMYAAKDQVHNHAIVLYEFLLDKNG